MAKVGSLYASLTLESTSFITNMKRAADATERGSRAIDKSLGIAKAGVAGFLGALTVDAMTGFVTRALDFAGGLGEVSQQLGVSTRSLQTYRYAATQVGISQETIDKGLAKFTRTLGEARNGSTSAQKAFADAGISLKELARLDTDTGIKAVADSLAAIPDPAKRAAIEVALFGRAGQQLDTLLAGGSKQINELAGAAEKLGIVLSDSQIQKADETADKLAAIKTVLAANFAGVVSDNAGAILSLADAFGSLGRQISGTARIYKEEGLLGVLTSSKETLEGASSARGRRGQLERKLAKLEGVGGRGAALERAQIRDTIAALFKEELAARQSATPKPTANDALDVIVKPVKSTTARSKVKEAALTDAQLRLGYGDKPIEIPVSLDVDQALQDFSTLGTAFDGLEQSAVALNTVDIISNDVLSRSRQFAENLTSGLGQALIYGQSLGDALVNSIQAAAAELVSSQLLTLLTGGKDGGGGLIGAAGTFFGSLFKPKARANGGPVTAGTPYMVGERGPELFNPSSSGNIIPNGAMRGMGGRAVVINQTFAPSFAGNAATKQDLLQMGAIVKAETMTSVKDALSRRGSWR